jgi:hypothetical protein
MQGVKITDLESVFWARVERKDPKSCWPWKGQIASNGYGHLWSGRGNVLAHRLAYAFVYKQWPIGLCVCHTCDVRHCCNPDHLKLGTPADNSRDMVLRGRSCSGRKNPAYSAFEIFPRGEHHGNARLTQLDVETIRSVYGAGAMTQKELSSIFGVVRTAITQVITGKNWKPGSNNRFGPFCTTGQTRGN